MVWDDCTGATAYRFIVIYVQKKWKQNECADSRNVDIASVLNVDGDYGANGGAECVSRDGVEIRTITISFPKYRKGRCYCSTGKWARRSGLCGWRDCDRICGHEIWCNLAICSRLSLTETINSQSM